MVPRIRQKATGSSMKFSVNAAKCLAIIATAAVGIGLSPRALACGKKPGQSVVANFGLSALLSEAQRPSSFTDTLPGMSLSPDQQASASQHPSIVGMWVLGFYHGDDPWDVGIEQFSSDGNEMTNDYAYPPAEGNICWGVWERIGNGQYKMTHIGWVFDANGAFFGRFDFAATITLIDHGNGFIGEYSSDQRDSLGNILPDYNDHGTLKATRFQVN
jgi:hypothetical protein